MKEKIMTRAAEIEIWMELEERLTSSEKYHQEELERYQTDENSNDSWYQERILKEQIALKACEKIREAILKAIG